MFLEPTYQFMRGFWSIKIEGYFIERFLNLCMQNRLEIWNVRKCSEVELMINILSKDFEKISEIANVTRCRIEVMDKRGFPSFLQRYQKRKVFILSLCLSVLFIIWYSSRIWFIEITGDFSIPINELYQELQKENVIVGMRKKDLDFDLVKNHIYRRRNDVSWMGFKIEGTRAVVEFVERNNIALTDDGKEIPCDIISNKTGVIDKILVKAGNRIVNVGDFVQSGDLLISGTVTAKDLTIRKVHSEGNITLKTWYTGKANIPFERDIPSETGRVQKKFQLKVGNYPINFLNNGTNFEKYDTIVHEDTLILLDRFKIPIALKTTVYHEVEVNKVTYTLEQAIKVAKSEAMADLKTQISIDEMQMGEDDFEIKINQDGVACTVTVECIENTGVKREIR